MSEHPFPSRSTLTLFTFVLGFVLPVAANAAPARVSEAYGQLPLHFEANQGQTHEDVRFLSRGPGYSLYLTAGEALLVLSTPNPDGKRDRHSGQARSDASAQPKSVALRMSLVGAARKPRVSGVEELPGKANYFAGSDPAKWRTNVPTYAKVHYREVYPGIDLVYYGSQRQLEYDFIVAPGADPKKIVLGFEGADRMEIDAEGDLVLHAPGGAMRQKKPVIYQELDGVRQEIAGSYVRKGTNRIGFKVAAYDRSRPLVIDPVLSYSTYLGSDGDDLGEGIAVDADGNAYVTGRTVSTNFPTTPGAFQTTADLGTFDAFVTKLNPAGSALVYSTYLGGSGDDYGYGIAVDAAGNAYVTGWASGFNFPTTAGAFQTTGPGGTYDAFVTKLNPTGSALIYSTYLGSSGDDGGNGIAVDADGNASVTGFTFSISFPTTLGAFQTTCGGSGSCADAFVTKLNPTGSAPVYSTYLGGSGNDGGSGIAVDADGNAYVTGSAFAGFPTTPGAHQPTFGGGLSDAIVTKLNPTGSALVYSTYLGGSGDEGGSGIAVDASSNAYITGSTGSTNFPTTPGAFQTAFAGGTGKHFCCLSPIDAFVTKLNPAGTALVYSTYLGGSGDDIGNGIAVDTLGNAYLTGATGSTNFPTTPGAFQTAFAGGTGGSGTFEPTDVFVITLNPTGTGLVYSTYLGGSGDDSGNGIAVDTLDNTYLTGTTVSTNFPTTPGAFQSANAGTSSPPLGDAFVAKIDNATTRSEQSAATYVGRWGTFGSETGTFSGGTIVASNLAASSATFSFTGTALSWIGVKCNVCGIAAVSIDGGLPTMVNTAGPAASGSLTSEVMFSASGLAPDVNHTLVITVTGTTSSSDAYIAVDAFDVTEGGAIDKAATRSEESAATYVGSWKTHGSEAGTFSGGTIVLSNLAASSATFSFTGTAVSWIGVKCNECGIAAVSIDGGLPTMVNTAGPAASGSLTSEVVYSASGLAAGSHTIAITVTGMTSSSNAYIAVDAFDVTEGGVAKMDNATTRSEESAATYVGSWKTDGSEVGTFSGGTIVVSNLAASSATFSFTGTALSWIGVKCSECGIAAVSIDGGRPTMVNTAGPAGGNLTSEVVYSASGLAAGSHTIAINVTGMTSSSNAYIAVDAFDVTEGGATSPLPVVLP